MRLTQAGLDNPTSVSVAIFLMLLFGGLAYFLLPVQLTPEVENPEITITTNWRAAAPEEIESEIVEPQEEALKSIPGLVSMEAKAQQQRAEIELTFTNDTNMQKALVEIISALGRVSDYPDDADEPYIRSVGSDARAIAWFILQPAPGNSTDITQYSDFVEDVVKVRFERVPGVARSELRGERKQELRITFDPYRAANLGVPLTDIARFSGAGQNVSGGTTEVGRHNFTVRYSGRYSAEDIGALILAWREGRPVFLRDLATVEVVPVDSASFVISAGRLSLAVNAQRENGVNVMHVMQGLRQAAAELSDGPLQRAGLQMKQVYDETIYIDNSIELLLGNLGLGVMLASIMLFLFLRNLRATLAVVASIPVCLMAGFMVLYFSGRTINVISLAGMAFALGMVLDASIVVLENIERLHRQQRLPPLQAANDATAQVFGALIASTVTTVIVFAPILFLRSEAGQLFSDLAITISGAICFSVLTALFVVPSLAAHWGLDKSHADDKAATQGYVLTASNIIMSLTSSGRRRLLWILGTTILPLAICWQLKPSLDYLPEGSRNLAIAFVQPPPGMGIDKIREEMGGTVTKAITPYVEGDQQPRVKHYFFVGFPAGVFMGAVARDPADLPGVVGVLNSIFSGIPDALGFARRTSLFGGFASGGRSIDMNLHGGDLEALYAAGQAGYGIISKEIPGARIRPIPGLVLGQPELRLLPKERRIAEAGWTRSEVAGISRALGDGLYAGDYFNGAKNIDIVVRGPQWDTPEALGDTPLLTPNLGVLPLSELVDIQSTATASQILRVNQRRTLTLQVNAPPGMSLDELQQLLRAKVEPKLWPLLPDDGEFSYLGGAEKLKDAVRDFGGSFILAVCVLFLIMAVLFRSYWYSLLVILTLPLAAVGGIIGLRVMNIFQQQPLDVLTMIGFITLLGMVVNNSILLVYRTRESEREGKGRQQAVQTALRERLRPILMTTATTVSGMLPLCLIPGSGTEIYRGLAVVIVGGMLCNLIFMLLLMPSLLRMGETKNA